MIMMRDKALVIRRWNCYYNSGKGVYRLPIRGALACSKHFQILNGSLKRLYQEKK